VTGHIDWAVLDQLTSLYLQHTGHREGQDADPGQDAGADPGQDAGADPGQDAGADPGQDQGQGQVCTVAQDDDVGAGLRH
jgi:hypothetical protein